jgi:hypothetical protein
VDNATKWDEPNNEEDMKGNEMNQTNEINEINDEKKWAELN